MKQDNFPRQLIPIPVEYVFALLGLVFGLFFVFANPPWQANDEDRHFIHSYFISQGQIYGKQLDKKIGGSIPINIVNTVQGFQGIPFAKGYKIKPPKTLAA